MASIAGEFDVYFQPRPRVVDNTIWGADSVARWHHPKRGLIEPAEFISACENLGLIDKLGTILFEESVRQQVEWARAGYELIVSVNLSAMHIAAPDFVERFCSLTKRHDASPRDIELEITESLLLGHERATIETHTGLRDLGFRIAIDEFGTGYSNLAYLHRYDFDCLKIDRSFISALDEAYAITDLIVAMAKLLDLTIVAEGVETDPQLAWLRSKQCQQYQGYLFSTPVDAATFYDLLKSQAGNADRTNKTRRLALN